MLSSLVSYFLKNIAWVIFGSRRGSGKNTFCNLEAHKMKLDYFIHKGKISFDVKDFFHVCTSTLPDRFFVIFHSFEVLFILWVAVFMTNFNVYLLGGVIGFTLHLLLDQCNIFICDFSRLFYFISFRAKKRFSKNLLKRS